MLGFHNHRRQMDNCIGTTILIQVGSGDLHNHPVPWDVPPAGYMAALVVMLLWSLWNCDSQASICSGPYSDLPVPCVLPSRNRDNDQSLPSVFLVIPAVIVGIVGLIPLIEHNQDSLRPVTRVFVALFGVYAGLAMLFLLMSFVVFTTLAFFSSTKSAAGALRKEDEIITDWVKREQEAVMRLLQSGSLRPSANTLINNENPPMESEPLRPPTVKTLIDNGNPMVEDMLKLASFLGWGTARTSAGHIKQFFVVFFGVLVLSLLMVYVLGTLYSDWVLGIVSGNLPGFGHTQKSKGLAAGWFLASIMLPF